ncbi:MAG: hypothetical protein KW788_00055 [Candidatus Doudnabacteria bacterium]|nr:hypothetical protein [Candidatus Doudnabacteria bacterium]
MGLDHGDELASLRLVSDHDFVRMLLDTLWAFYDSGGISCDRSLRASAVEAARRLLPGEDPATNNLSECKWSLADIFYEAKSRAPQARQVFLFPVTKNLVSMLDSQLAVLIIKSLVRTLHSETAIDDVDANAFDLNLLYWSLKFLPALVKYPNISLGVLLEEERRRAHCRRQSEYNYMQSIGCGAWPTCDYPNQRF